MAKRKNIGKVFEEEIKSSIPAEFYVERYKDDTAGFKGVANPADFRLYKYPYTFLIECKSHKGKSLPLDMIRDAQIKGLVSAGNYLGIYAGFLINFRDLEETYYIPADLVLYFILHGDRKSIPVGWCRDIGVRIEQKKKRVRYSYNLREWLGGYYDGGKAL